MRGMALPPRFRSLAMATSLSPSPSSSSILPLPDRLSALLPFDRPRSSHFSTASPDLPLPKRLPYPSIRSAVASPLPSKPAPSRKPRTPQLLCPGCGVAMQEKDPDAPGFFQRPRRLVDGVEQEESLEELVGSLGLDEDAEEEDEENEEDDEEGADENDEEESPKEARAGWTWVSLSDKGDEDGKVSSDSLDSLYKDDKECKDDKEWRKSLDGFRPAGPEYGRSDGGWNQVGGHRVDVKAGRLDREKGKDKEKEAEKLLVCARCHELRNYGKVKDTTAENLLPDFDFERTVGARLMKTHAARTIVVMVVDAADFDGSFPRRVASLLSQLDEREGGAWKQKRSGNVPRLVLVVNKIDLLPKQISPIRLDHWIRRRAKEGGAPRLSGLFLVSCIKSWGVRAVLLGIKDLAGPRGEVWVVGTQNAGKSSLINALSKVEEGTKLTQLTEAPVPGTTLGIVRLDGILPAKAKLFDTPGLLHPHQITLKLTREEQKRAQIRKELRPRTYRIKANDTIHVGGLARLDVADMSAGSMYVTIWASPLIPCHLGKTVKAADIYEKHVGDKLQPPFNKERLDELGPWVRTPVSITGDSWDKNSVDIAVAGMGWFALGLKGTANLDIWTYEGVAITTRHALVPDMATTFEKSGFTVVKGVTAKVN